MIDKAGETVTLMAPGPGERWVLMPAPSIENTSRTEEEFIRQVYTDAERGRELAKLCVSWATADAERGRELAKLCVSWAMADRMREFPDEEKRMRELCRELGAIDDGE